MKHKILLGALFFSAAGIFSACSDDNDSNPTLIQPTEFILNTPAYVNETVDLATTTALQLSWSQPKFTDGSPEATGAPINATYEIQVSPVNSFTVSYADAEADESGALTADYAVLDKTTTTCTTEIASEDIDKALVQVAKWSESSTPSEQAVYIRVNAYVLEGSTKLNEIASNVVTLNVNPYYIELSDATPIMFYMVGNNIGDGAWSNSPGVSSMPMFLQSGYAYDKKTGAGEITYLNYFTTDAFKIQPTDFDWNYGFMSGGSANKAAYRDGGNDDGNIWVDPAGYYLITVNTGTNTCTIEQQDITPAVYEQICITGSFSDWGDVNMTPANKSGENHVWYYTLTVAEGETAQVKFKIPDSWDTNWGYGSENGEVNVCGKGTNGGKNIGVAEGTWLIGFNDITGEFSIIAVNNN